MKITKNGMDGHQRVAQAAEMMEIAWLVHSKNVLCVILLKDMNSSLNRILSSTQPTNKSLKATDDDDSAAKDALQLCCFYHKFLTYGFCSHVSSLLLDQHFQDERGNFCMAH